MSLTLSRATSATSLFSVFPLIFLFTGEPHALMSVMGLPVPTDSC